MALGKTIWVRHVVVPGLTDGRDDILRLADFIAGLGPQVERVDLLPFHQMGAHKWEQLGMDYPLAGVAPPTADCMAAARQLFASRGVRAI